MESPFSWRKAEHVVYNAEREWAEAQAKGIVGASRTIIVTNALREAGLLVESPEDATSLNILPGRFGQPPEQPKPAPPAINFTVKTN